MSKSAENGLYFIDSNFRILYFNDAVKSMYPEVKCGQYCYESLACRNSPCLHCPLVSSGMKNSFYNPIRSEWISAHAAKAELPGIGKCHSITFSMSPDINGEDNTGALATDTLEGGDRTGMIGGYCEDGFPLLFANEKMIKMLGYDDYEDFYNGIKGLVANTIHPDDMAQVVADIGPSYYVGLEYETVYRMPRKDGSWFWTRDKGRVIETGDGRLAIVSYCTDITDALQRQEQLEQLNKQLSQQNKLMEFINDGMPGGYHRCAITEGYPFLYVSSKFLNMIGFTVEELRDKFDNKFINLVHPDDRAFLANISEKAISDGARGEISAHYRILTKNGYLQVVDTTRISEYGKNSFFQGVIIDISGEEQIKESIESFELVQKALQDALVREQQYRQRLDALQNNILNSISCGVLAYSLSDNKIITVNEAAKRMIGCNDEDEPMQALELFLSERVVPKDRKSVRWVEEQLNGTGGVISRDFKATVDGRPINIHANIKRLESTDDKPYILITMVNITEPTRLTALIEKERKAYRDAPANGSAFSFLFDVTDGLLYEEFITAQGVNLIKELGFSVPVSYDELLAKYVDACEIEFASEEMEKHFTRKGLLEVFEEGMTNVVTEFYNPQRDTFFRVNCLLAVDGETGHVNAAVVAEDITDIRKKDKLQQAALKAANDEMNVRIDTILDGICGGLKIIDTDNGYSYSYISEGAARLQGYSTEEFLERFGQSMTSNICNDEGGLALAEINRQAAETGSFTVKYRVKHKDGGIRWVIDRGKLVEDPLTGHRLYYVLMQDITDLEDRNAQLNDVITMQKHMADSLGSGIFAYTLPEHEVLLLNQEARRMFECIGSDPSSYGMDIISKIVAEDMPKMRAAVKQLVSPGDSVEYIFHSESVADGLKTFKCSTKLLSFANGQRYILSAITDITEQELTEKRLDEERLQYRDALALGSAGFFTVNMTDGRVSSPILSKEGEDITRSLGITLPAAYDLLASIWLSDKRIATDDPTIKIVKSREKLIKYFQSGNSILDMEYHLPEENKYYRLMVLLYKVDASIYASFIIYDITADRHDERQRRSIIASLGKIYSALYLFSFQEQSCTVLKINSDIAHDLPERCSFQHFYNLYTKFYVDPEHSNEVAAFLAPENIKSALADSDYVSIEFKRKNLGWCRVNLVAANRDNDGVVTSVVFAGNVIEKQKQSELAQQEALRAAYESANIANAAKTDFLARMSHDIRTPMNAIIGMTAIAGTHLDDRERLTDCLSKISVSSKHLLGIINEVLDMSKIESGKMELQEEEFNLPELIDNLITMSKAEVISKNHNFSVSICGVEHENVIGDSQRIQQVFMNLMSNAIKYTPAGGRIELTISEKATNKQQIGCYEFVFKDNGIGMSEDYIRHIFEPFSRATEDVRVDKVQGTGLGMPITKNIVQMMNGDIKVESELNVGTSITVTFFLRLQSADEKIANETLVELPILVADDDEDSCLYTCELLKEIGMNGEWVLTGQEAVERALSRHREGRDFFAVILDWKMPGMDGVETTKEIRRKIGENIPIVIISAYDWSDIELEARAAGANAFISKPLFKSRVVHTINELLNGEKKERSLSELDALKTENFVGKRALVVEDNALNAEIAGEILGMAGLEVEFAANGKEALDIMTKAASGRFDVIFMDIQMPIMNGYEAARAIRELPDNYAKAVPILAMTANAFAEDVAAAKNSGMNEHIAKPLDFDQLTKALKKWLN